MKWLSLYDKLRKQPIRITRTRDIEVIVDGKAVKVTGIKFKADGTPYLVTDREDGNPNG